MDDARDEYGRWCDPGEWNGDEYVIEFWTRISKSRDADERGPARDGFDNSYTLTRLSKRIRLDWAQLPTYHPVIRATDDPEHDRVVTSGDIFSEDFLAALATRPAAPAPIVPIYLPSAQAPAPRPPLPEPGDCRALWKERVGYVQFTGPYARIQSLLWGMIQRKTYGSAFYSIEHGTETGILRKPEEKKFGLSDRKKAFNDIWLFFLDKVAIEGFFWRAGSPHDFFIGEPEIGLRELEAFFSKEIATRFAWLCEDSIDSRKTQDAPLRFRRLSETELLGLYKKIHRFVRAQFKGEIVVQQEDARGDLFFRLKDEFETCLVPKEDEDAYINKAVGNEKNDCMEGKEGDLIHLYKGGRARSPQGGARALGPWWKVAGILGPTVYSNWIEKMHGTGGASTPSEGLEDDEDPGVFLRAASEPNAAPDTSGDSDDEEHRDGWLEGLQAIQQRAFRNQGPLPFLDDVRDEHNREDALHLTNWKLTNLLARPEESWRQRNFLVKLFDKDHEEERREFQAQLSKGNYPVMGAYPKKLVKGYWRKGGPRPMPIPLPKNLEKKMGAYRQYRAGGWTLDEIKRFWDLPRGHRTALKARGCVPPGALNDTDIRRLNQFLYNWLHEWGFVRTTTLRSDRLARALYSPIIEKKGNEEADEDTEPTIGNCYHRGKAWSPEPKYRGVWKKHIDLLYDIRQPAMWAELQGIDFPDHLLWVQAFWLPQTQGVWDAWIAEKDRLLQLAT